MGGINTRSAVGALQESVNNKDLREESFVTGQPIGSARRAIDTIPVGLTLVSSDVIEAGSTNNLVVLTAHGALRGDILRITSSANGIIEKEIVIDEIVDADNFKLGAILSAALAIGDTVDILRPVTPTYAADGSTLAALTFQRDGVSQQVIEDTVTPANNRPLPVKLTGMTGDITVTAQNLNMQSTHTGANPDSMQIGDGTHLLDINADGSINTVLDTPNSDKLTDIETNTQATADVLGTPSDAKELDPDALTATIASLLRGILENTSIVGTGDASAANQLTQITAEQAIQAAVEAINAKLGTLGQKNMAGSAPVVIASDQSAIPVTGTFYQATQPVSAASLPLPTGAATEAKQDTGNTSLSNIDGDLGATGDAAVTNPAASASVIAALKGLLTLIASSNTKLDEANTNLGASTDVKETDPDALDASINALLRGILEGVNTIGGGGTGLGSSPTSWAKKTSSYTVPVGKCARVFDIFGNLTVDTVLAGYSESHTVTSTSDRILPPGTKGIKYEVTFSVTNTQNESYLEALFSFGSFDANTYNEAKIPFDPSVGVPISTDGVLTSRSGAGTGTSTTYCMFKGDTRTNMVRINSTAASGTVTTTLTAYVPVGDWITVPAGTALDGTNYTVEEYDA